MSAQPWGRTGRVTIDGDVGDPRALPNVHVDGEWVGWLYTPDDNHPKWGARVSSAFPHRYRDDIPTLDAAVMWVLRRAAPKVWREERGEVCRVRYVRDLPRFPWVIAHPVGPGDSYYETHAAALEDAALLTRLLLAREAAP